MAEARARRPRIFDAVYGYVELNEHEFRLVNTAIFQRLHWIKQLGPLHTVFPSAQHSRFSHSIGVFYIAKRMIEHLKSLPREYKYPFTRDEEKVLRFAALLHDIGHVPLSHIGERVLADDMEARIKAEDSSRQQDTHTLDLLSTKSGGKAWHRLFPDPTIFSRTKLHERLSAEIVLYDREIDGVLTRVWRDKGRREECKQRIARAIVGMNLLDIPTLLLHSELDADRLDYLLRDSFFTGVGYGQVDLDYIISRLVVYRRDAADLPILCVEHKGLHTIEHYILGRFFLQTQVIYNRKVRLLDILFEDVMRYMLTEAAPDHCRLMHLRDFCDHIHQAQGRDRRSHLHEIYSYTDAEVFTRMRSLHEHLDGKEKAGNARQQELYINDCIKTIMDGSVPDPVFHTCHKLVDKQGKEDYERALKRKAKLIVKRIAEELGTCPERIKPSFRCEPVMKYERELALPTNRRRRSGRITSIDVDDETNPQEAVRVMFKPPSSVDTVRYAAECNGTILGSLADKALLLFNCCYVAPKGRADNRNVVEARIRKAFAEFIDKEFYQ